VVVAAAADAERDAAAGPAAEAEAETETEAEVDGAAGAGAVRRLAEELAAAVNATELPMDRVRALRRFGMTDLGPHAPAGPPPGAGALAADAGPWAEWLGAERRAGGQVWRAALLGCWPADTAVGPAHGRGPAGAPSDRDEGGRGRRFGVGKRMCVREG
jgi:hypothetical protein